jgi:hypothetical protein
MVKLLFVWKIIRIAVLSNAYSQLQDQGSVLSQLSSCQSPLWFVLGTSTCYFLSKPVDSNFLFWLGILSVKVTIIVCVQVVMPCFRLSNGARIPYLGTWFNPRVVLMGFVVNKMTLEKAFLQVPRFSVSVITPILYKHCHPHMVGAVGPFEAACQGSQWHSTSVIGTLAPRIDFIRHRWVARLYRLYGGSVFMEWKTMYF